VATPSGIGAEEPAAGAAGVIDFFVSYTSADRPWAEWIAWELEHAGHSVVIQAWDFGPGSNFVLAMHEAAQRARRTITVLSPAFLQSPYCASEWAAALRVDPMGKGRKLVPVRVRECAPEGLLGSVVYVDVVGLSESASRAALLAGVTEGRGKPVGAPAFPGTHRGVEGERVRRPEAGAAIFNVPVATRTFVGRQEQLRRLGEGLSGDGAVAITQVHAIHGMGGVGKTQLAARYARQQREGYDVVWWVRAEQQPTLRADLAGMAAALGLVDAEADEQDAITAAREWLEQHERWLLVFDNATGPDALADLLPEGSGGHVLITSRTHADWRGLHATPLALDVWARAESREFLRERTGEQDTGMLNAVAEVLGDLPLALEQAVAYASTQAITLSAYADRLRDRAPRLFAAGRPPGYEHSVATVWQLAFEQVAKHPVAQQLLEVCAFLGPEGIPRELLEAFADDSAPPGISAEDVDDAIAVLLGYALLTRSVEGSFAMHRLVGQLAREHADTDTRRSAARLAATILTALWPERPWEHEHWPMCQRLLTHALTTTKHTEQLDAEHALTATLLGRVGQYQEARAEYRPAQQQLERALATFSSAR